MFVHLSSSPRSLPFVQRVRVRKTVQRSMNLKRRKQPISHEGGGLPRSNLPPALDCLLIGVDRKSLAHSQNDAIDPLRTWSVLQPGQLIAGVHRCTSRFGPEGREPS